MDIKNRILEIIKLPKKILIIMLAILIAILVLIIVSGYVIINNLSEKNYNSGNEIMSEVSLGSTTSSYDSMMHRSFSKRKMIATSPSPAALEQTADYNESIERKIIKNGNLSLVVKDIDIAKKTIENIVKKYNGFIQSANFSENENRVNYGVRNSYESKQITFRNGNYQVKIPSNNFRVAFEEFKKVALKVNNENISANDITEEYQDLETQIKNKKAEEEQYRIILKRSGKISEVLEVTKYLNTARKERERLEGRLNYLSNQVELSSININLVAEEDVAVMGVVWSPLTELKVGVRNFLEDGKDFLNSIINFLFKLPFYLIWFVIIIFGIKYLWKVLKKIKKIVFK